MTRTYRRCATPAEYSGPLRVCMDCRGPYYPKVNNRGRVDLNYYAITKRCPQCSTIENGLKLIRVNKTPEMKAGKAAVCPIERSVKATLFMLDRWYDPVKREKLIAAHNSPVTKELRRRNMLERMNKPEVKKAASERMRKQLQDPKFQEALRNKRKPVLSEADRQARSEFGRTRGQLYALDPELRSEYSEKVKKGIADAWKRNPAGLEREKAKSSERMERRWKDPAWAAKLRKASTDAAAARLPKLQREREERFVNMMIKHQKMCEWCDEPFMPSFTDHSVEPESLYAKRKFCCLQCAAKGANATRWGSRP